MPKKEEIGYGILIVFVLASLFFITLMVPFDTVTGAAVFDISVGDLKNSFFMAALPNFALLVVLSIWIIGGSLMVMKQKRDAEGALEKIPRMSRIELKEYVRQSLEKGFKEEDISEALLAQGWDEKVIDAVLKMY